MSPTLVSEYQTTLPSQAVLRAKLCELYAQLNAPGVMEPVDETSRSKKQRRQTSSERRTQACRLEGERHNTKKWSSGRSRLNAAPTDTWRETRRMKSRVW